MDETYIKVRGQWRYLYRAIDSVGDTAETFLYAASVMMLTRRLARSE
jgi:putative transposase